jgi:hypothetical protein
MKTRYQVRSVKIDTKLFLNELTIIPEGEVKTPVSTNHVFCCDISGSMWDSLPKMRNQLKNRIPDIVQENDTVTIVVFSGRGECTTLKELVQVNDLNSLKALNDAIDRYMKPTGMTCFLDPVEMTRKLVGSHLDENWSFIFLSDGGNNDCAWADVIHELELLEPKVSSSTIIEYGYYADTDKLNDMTEVLGGTKIQAPDFESYVPVIENSLRSQAEEKVVVNIGEFKQSMKYQQLAYFNRLLCSVNVLSTQRKEEVLVPASIDKVYFLSEKSLGEDYPVAEATDAMYMMAYVTASALKYEVTESILSKIGSKKFIDMYCNAFGKQKLFEFQAELLDATYDESKRGTEFGEYKANPKAYCVLDLLEELQNGQSKIRVVDPAFKYNRIGAKSIVKQQLTPQQILELSQAKTKLQAEKMIESIDNEVKMTMVDQGYPISDFTWNEERANLSALIKIDVNLKLPENNVGLSEIPSFVFRNYTIIKDGILNVTTLPIEINKDTFNELKSHGVVNYNFEELEDMGDGYRYTILDISDLPIVNKYRTKSVKCSVMSEEVNSLTRLKFSLKYLGYLKKKYNVVSTSPSARMNYTAEQLNYLESLGITEKGYSPKTELDKSGDFYMALALKSNMKGFSSIPKIEDVEKKLEQGKKLTPSEQYMRNVMTYVDARYLDKGGRDNYLNAIRTAFTELSISKEIVQRQLSIQKFALILSKRWFSDKNGFDDNAFEFEDDFGTKQLIEYRFTEVKQNL